MNGLDFFFFFLEGLIFWSMVGIISEQCSEWDKAHRVSAENPWEDRTLVNAAQLFFFSASRYIPVKQLCVLFNLSV